jgi:hypothetical protein
MEGCPRILECKSAQRALRASGMQSISIPSARQKEILAAYVDRTSQTDRSIIGLVDCVCPLRRSWSGGRQLLPWDYFRFARLIAAWRGRVSLALILICVAT